MDDLTKTVWITGASTGIGAALAENLAKQGYIVAASARSADKLQQLAGQNYGAGRIVAYPLDVTDGAAVEAVVGQIRATHGRIDIAILNAGVHHHESGLDITLANSRKIFELNVFGILNCVTALLPDMRARKSGHLALVGSVAGYRGLPSAAAYCASKAAVISLAESLRPSCEEAGIKLQLICPGFVKTPMTDQNHYPMPFIIDATEAASIIARGLNSNKFEIVFPWPMMILMKFIRYLPYLAYLPLSRLAAKIKRSA